MKHQVSKKAKILVEAYVQCAQIKSGQSIVLTGTARAPALDIINCIDKNLSETQEQLFSYISELETAFYSKDKRRTNSNTPKTKSSSVTKVKSTDQIIKDIVADQLGLDKRKKAKLNMENALVDNLGCDSLDVLEIVMLLEETFEIEIPDHAIEECRTLKDLHDVVVVFKA